jgi:hypothetical protein
MLVKRLFGNSLTKPKVVIKPLAPPLVDSVAIPIVALDAVEVFDCANCTSLFPPLAPEM